MSLFTGIAVTEVFRNCDKHPCELCEEMVELPVSQHMQQAHPGCGRPAGGLGYNYTGLFIRGWRGLCGVAGDGEYFITPLTFPYL